MSRDNLTMEMSMGLNGGREEVEAASQSREDENEKRKKLLLAFHK